MKTTVINSNGVQEGNSDSLLTDYLRKKMLKETLKFAAAAAYAADAADAADADAAAAAYAAAAAAAYAAYAAYAAAAAAAKKDTLKQCADIVRKHYPKAPKL